MLFLCCVGWDYWGLMQGCLDEVRGQGPLTRGEQAKKFKVSIFGSRAPNAKAKPFTQKHASCLSCGGEHFGTFKFFGSFFSESVAAMRLDKVNPK